MPRWSDRLLEGKEPLRRTSRAPLLTARLTRSARTPVEPPAGCAQHVPVRSNLSWSCSPRRGLNQGRLAIRISHRKPPCGPLSPPYDACRPSGFTEVPTASAPPVCVTKAVAGAATNNFLPTGRPAGQKLRTLWARESASYDSGHKMRAAATPRAGFVGPVRILGRPAG